MCDSSALLASDGSALAFEPPFQLSLFCLQARVSRLSSLFFTLSPLSLRATELWLSSLYLTDPLSCLRGRVVPAYKPPFHSTTLLPLGSSVPVFEPLLTRFPLELSGFRVVAFEPLPYSSALLPLGCRVSAFGLPFQLSLLSLRALKL